MKERRKEERREEGKGKGSRETEKTDASVGVSASKQIRVHHSSVDRVPQAECEVAVC